MSENFKSCEICGDKYPEEFWTYLTEVEDANESITCCKTDCEPAARKRLIGSEVANLKLEIRELREEVARLKSLRCTKPKFDTRVRAGEAALAAIDGFLMSCSPDEIEDSYGELASAAAELWRLRRLDWKSVEAARKKP